MIARLITNLCLFAVVTAEYLRFFNMPMYYV
ncbi:unnamed protein product, partial [Anisakis simplex]|uniref:CDP-diacylglycerol--serine O-phosphatidyltransferase n=1 Tax=Anisakis simplex TaxID=6269 RepID=A0A0M3J940_ANISI